MHGARGIFAACALWFPQGLDAPSLGLFRVDILKAQYWNAQGGAMTSLVEAPSSIDC